MPLQNFVARSLPTIKAAWLNAVDVLKFTVFDDAATKAQARTALTSDASFTVSTSLTGGAKLTQTDFNTYLQAATPITISGVWTFTNSWTSGNPGGLTISAAVPFFELHETGASTDEARWCWNTRVSEQLLFQTANGARTSFGTIMGVTRVNTTVSRVSFPSDGTASQFSIGEAPATTGQVCHISTISAGAAILTKNITAAVPTEFVWNTATAGDNKFIEFYTEGGGGSLRGSITYNRGGGVVAYNTSCREALKTNIRPSAGALPLLMQLPIVSFDWRDSPAKLPYFVTYERMEPLVPWACQNDGVDVSKLGPLTICAVQELQRQLQAALARISALEAVSGAIGASK